MARRSRKNGRYTKSSSRRRRKPKVNLVNAAVSLAVANSVSRNIAGVNLRDFLFAGTQFSDLHESGWNYVGGKGGNNYNAIITLSEILRGTQDNSSGLGNSGRPSVATQLADNLKTNIVPLTIGVVGIPVAAKVLTKLLRKPMLTPMNRMIKMTGLDVKV